MEENYTRKPGAPGAAFGDRPPGATGMDRPGAPQASKPGEPLSEARQQIGSLANEAKEQGKAALSRGKDSAAAQVGTVADSLHATAEQLIERDQVQAGRFIDYAAERLDDFSRRVRDKDLDGLIEDATRIGRKSPGTLFAGSVAAGFLLSRFMKSSAKPRARGAASGPPASGTQRREPVTQRREPVAATSLRPSGSPVAPVNAPGGYPARGPGDAPNAPTGKPSTGGRPE